MNKNTMTIMVATLLALVMVVALSIYFLYKGVSSDGENLDISSADAHLLRCVPTDAVAVIQFSDIEDVVGYVDDSLSILQPFLLEENMKNMLSLVSDVNISEAVISYHHVGTVQPLLIIELSRFLRSNSKSVEDFKQKMGDVKLSYIDLGDHIWAISPSRAVAESSKKHLESDISVLDSKGFISAVNSQSGTDRVFISLKKIDKIYSSFIGKSYKNYSSFIKKFADWKVFSIKELSETSLLVSGSTSFDLKNNDFIKVLSSCEPGRSGLVNVLSKHVVSFAALPLANFNAYIKAYETYSDYNINIGSYELKHDALKRKFGVSPIDWATSLDVREVGISTSVVNFEEEKLLYLRFSEKKSTILAEMPKEETSGLMEYKYPEYISSLFGGAFSLEDESHCIVKGNWIIIGSKNALERYLVDIEADNLKSYMKSADLDYMINRGPVVYLSYFSLSEDIVYLKKVFAEGVSTSLAGLTEGYSYTPLVFSIEKNGEELMSNLDFQRTVVKQKLDETVLSAPVVTKGPFTVRNSGTKKDNFFTQKEDMALTMVDESGKTLWTTKFQTPICGRVAQVDYFKNSKLQYLFASGTKLYLIDRLGRMVKPFPIDLKKEILLGPDVYDFNNKRTYNFFVLFQDNTIRMYNLQGRVPAQWKDIAPKETIVGLPEKLSVSGKTYWVVRTNVQTLIYPFLGGNSLVNFEGDKMISPNSKIVPQEGASVQVTSYDGTKR